jgi:hypothetical protein|tara:strand:+ start:377 stop:910 length:534 start_codon:yes stop_codon:yes gene_type:complete
LIESLVVAPREVYDLVFRCARVAGCDPGTADRVARNVMVAEARWGGAVAVAVGVFEAEDPAGSAPVRAPDVLAEAECDARTTGSARAEFEAPVPLAFLVSTIAEMAGRGVVVDDLPIDATAGLPVPGLGLRTGVADRPSSVEAHRGGLSVDRVAFNRLEAMAGRFLVSEAILDGIEP